ncbi:MAG: ShlB/FhaC/HecB family hemolysin secretion/activation protein [Pseudomonadota bacterium]
MSAVVQRAAPVVLSFAVATTGANAQKVENPVAIPQNVRPGAIEAQLDVEVAPGVTMAPSVISPYRPEQPEDASAIEFQLTEIIIDGASAIAPSALEPLYADRIGETIALSEVFAIARKITGVYADAGYPLSLAYVPIQVIEDGKVRIRIIEGFIGEIDISDAPPRTHKRLRKLADKIAAERPLTQRSLERYLLLANEIPGLSVTGVLERGAAPDRGVKMTLKVSQKRLAVAASLNNRASRAVGRKQFNGRLRVNNLLTGADAFQFLAVQSTSLDELTFFSAGYSTVLTGEGLTLDVAATRSEAAPGVPLLRNLGFETMGWTASAGLSYPLVLKRDTQITLRGGVSWKEFQSAFDVTPNTLDTLWTMEVGAAARFKDPLDGANAIGVTLVRGWDIFDATQAGSPLASRAGAGGEFIAVVGDIGRTQKLSDRVTLSLSAKAQAANNPLLSSEQCGYGGAGFGRGYDPFEIGGDRCIAALLELSAEPAFLQHGKFKALPFVSIDAGAVRQNGPLAAGETRTASLYSVAAGARMKLTRYLSASAEVGVPLKGVVAQEGDDDPRFFFSVTARY